MGINNFHKWLSTNYKSAYIELHQNNIYDFIYIDVNFLLHNCIYSCSNEKEFIKKLYYHFDIIFSNFIATKEVFFSIDGVAPKAKFNLQKKRRKSMMCDKTEFNSLLLTPGTKFMDKIHEYLEIYISKIKKRYQYLKPSFVVSTSNEPGEGEMKISARLINNGKMLNLKHLIVGNDADIIILSMAAKKTKNINVLFKNKKVNELISINKLIEAIVEKINNKNKREEKIREEFVFVSLLMGNDYLPKLGYMSIEKLWQAYFQTVNTFPKVNLIKNGSFNFIFLEKLLLNIYNNLSNTFKKPTTKYNPKKYLSYFVTLLWCHKMYTSGECSNYEHIYKYKNVIHPFELLLYCSCNKTKIEIPVSNNKPVSVKEYASIVLPLNSLHLITK